MSRIESGTVAEELVEARSGKTDLNESSWVFAQFHDLMKMKPLSQSGKTMEALFFFWSFT